MRDFDDFLTFRRHKYVEPLQQTLRWKPLQIHRSVYIACITDLDSFYVKATSKAPILGLQRNVEEGWGVEL